jgi:hypothetical protein
MSGVYNGGCLCEECTTPQVPEVHTARLEVTDEWTES